jgi:hypothetical protein
MVIGFFAVFGGIEMHRSWLECEVLGTISMIFLNSSKKWRLAGLLGNLSALENSHYRTWIRRFAALLAVRSQWRASHRPGY